MSAPLVSVVMPCYRCADTVQESVRSVKAQTLPDWELIAVDDGSDDGTPDVLRALAEGEPRMRVLHQANGGVSRARNAGMDAAAGRWLCFLDADDYLAPDALERLLDQAGEADVVCGAYIALRGETSETMRCAHGGRLEWMESLLRGDSALNPMWGKLYRARLLREKRLRAPEGVAIGEDVLFNLDALAASDAWRIVDEPVYTYNEREGSAMAHARTGVYRSSLPMLRGIDAFLAREGLETPLFRAHIDAYLRTLRADRGRLAAAAAMCGEPSRAVTHGVRMRELPPKQKLYCLALRFAPIFSFFLP